MLSMSILQGCLPSNSALAEQAVYPSHFSYEPEYVCFSNQQNESDSYQVSSFYFEAEQFEGSLHHLVLIEKSAPSDERVILKQTIRFASTELNDVDEMIWKFVDGSLTVSNVNTDQRSGSLKINGKLVYLDCQKSSETL